VLPEPDHFQGLWGVVKLQGDPV